MYLISFLACVVYARVNLVFLRSCIIIGVQEVDVFLNQSQIYKHLRCVLQDILTFAGVSHMMYRSGLFLSVTKDEEQLQYNTYLENPGKL